MNESNVTPLKPATAHEKGEAIHEHLQDIVQRLSLAAHVLYETNALQQYELETRAVIQLSKAVDDMDVLWREMDELLIMIRPRAEVSNG